MPITLQLLDEVNCKFLNLDLDVRKSLIRKYKIPIPNARYLPAVRLGRWDGCVNFFNLGGSTYINLLPEIIEYLELRGIEIELDDQRQNFLNFEFEPVTESSFSHKCWGEGHPVAGQPILLRLHQVEAINKFLTNPQGLVELPTSSGKTLITAALSQRVEKFGRSIIIVPSKSLVEQTEVDYRNLDLDVGVYFGDRKELNKTHTICTWQSLGNLMKKSKNGEVSFTIKDFLEDVICVMVDEAHICSADILKTLLTGVMSNIPIRWGLTGTIPKEDFQIMSLRVSLGEVFHKLSANELQEAGVLSNCHINIKQLQDFKEYKTYAEEIKYLVEDKERLNYIASMVMDIAKDGNTLVLVPRIGSGKKLANLIPNSVFLDGGTKVADRKEQYDEVATSTNKIIIATTGIAAVGINIPRIFNLVLFEPGKSYIRSIQSCGRGLRRAHDKDFVNIYDICSSCKFSKRHLTKRKAYYSAVAYPFTVEKINWL